MARREILFDAVREMTPDFAAKLANCASQYKSRVYIEKDKTALYVDSLIGILSMALRRGTCLWVCAEGEDAEAAVEAVSALLTERRD